MVRLHAPKKSLKRSSKTSIMMNTAPQTSHHSKE